MIKACHLQLCVQSVEDNNVKSCESQKQHGKNVKHTHYEIEKSKVIPYVAPHE